MTYSPRVSEQRLFQAFESPWVTAVLGPRRVGKSTLVEHFFNQRPHLTVIHFNMDKMHEREKIAAGLFEDMILTTIRRPLVGGQRVWVTVDEAQKCPPLFDQVKLLYDQYKDSNALKFILTGSALLELHRLSAESLAGRVQLYSLAAFNLSEAACLKYQVPGHSALELIQNFPTNESIWDEYRQPLRPHAEMLQSTLHELLLWGGFPEMLGLPQDSYRLDYLSNYLQTYLEKDVRAIESISDLPLYRHLLDIVAEQTGSIRDDSKLLQSLHCHRDTLNKYRGYLQATLLYQDIPPYINSSLKRLVKSPKGFLINNGLLSYLTGLYEALILTKTGQMGHRLENWFLNELNVWLNQQTGHHHIHYWRTSGGVEVDFVVHLPPRVIPFEVTTSQKIESRKIKNLLNFMQYEPTATIGYYIYQGEFRWDAHNKIVCLPAWWI